MNMPSRAIIFHNHDLHEVLKMKKRFKVPNKKSKKQFTKTAKKVHPKNFAPRPMRGGIRL